MIEIFNYKEVHKKPLKANFCIKIKKWKDFCIYNLTWFQTENTSWITFPSMKYQKDGKDKYFPYCGYSEKEINEAFKAEILKAVQEYASNNTGMNAL